MCWLYLEFLKSRVFLDNGKGKETYQELLKQISIVIQNGVCC